MQKKKNIIAFIVLPILLLLAVGAVIFYWHEIKEKSNSGGSVNFSNRENILENFRAFIAIQSVSTLPDHQPQMTEAASYLTKKLEEIGCTVKIFHEGTAPALIAARYDVEGATKTVGIYGHYDVVPSDTGSGWRTDPFNLTVLDGKIYGRGTADNKGHVIQNLAAVEALIKSGELKNNVVFVFEGEEEVGSANFEKYAEEAKDFIAADVYYITDGQMHAKNEPQIDFALRGLNEYELTVSTGEKDLHSGFYGNNVINSIQVETELFAKMKDAETNKVNIPDFYGDMKPITESDRNLYAKLEWTKDAKQKEMGIYELVGTDEKQPWISALVYPSLEINGITGGYTGDGFKPIIPSVASAKFSVRLVEFQDPKKITELIDNFIKDNLPVGAHYDLKVVQELPPFYTDYNNQYVLEASKIMTEEFGNNTVISRSGGSAGAASMLQSLFKVPFVLTGFTLPDNNIHSTNENYDEDMFWKGIEVMKKMYNS
ncbi:MAG: M20/M25/M40 family metallo-hydrolase [Candidatus Berkelbacteria bacterium]|nr:M20/M25/M40 family metallo-hydrolase [Candidatus Berkelbacteria bacterium]